LINEKEKHAFSFLSNSFFFCFIPLPFTSYLNRRKSAGSYDTVDIPYKNKVAIYLECFLFLSVIYAIVGNKNKPQGVIN